MNIEDTKHPEAFLIGQINGTLKFSGESARIKLRAIGRYIEEYEADQEAREQAERREEERNDPMNVNELPF